MRKAPTSEGLAAGSPVIVLITTENPEEARRISRALLEKRLIACANLAPGIESHYWWKGNLECATEVLLILKTLAGQVERVRELVRALHSYEVFELIVLPIIDGSPEYLSWLSDEVRPEASG